MENCCCVILAAGGKKRMQSTRPAAMAEILFKPMIDWVLDAVQATGIRHICTVTGDCGEALCDHLANRSETVRQSEPLGTGHAVLQAKGFLERFHGGDVLIVNGDTPLMDGDTLLAAYEEHKRAQNAITVISACVEDPSGYGRIVRAADGAFTRIMEERDANDTIRQIREINSGACWFQCDRLLAVLGLITNENARKEYYLTDAVRILRGQGCRAGAFAAMDPDVVLAASDGLRLFELNARARQRVLTHWLLEGVDIPCADGVCIGPDVTVGVDTRILPGTILRGKTTVGRDCVIGPNTQLIDTVVGDGAKLDNVLSEQAQVEERADIGPFVHLRPNAKIGPHTHLGNFVEVKNAQIGEGTKVSHLTYVGDADVGKSVNFGCGCVTVNYTGKEKHRTVIGDHAFIGCNTNLVAPVKVGDYGYTAAGSTITEDVPANALGIARARQVNKEGWVLRKKPYKGMK
ncbi:MAG TPA: bifunctional UDP-N-acetylglucosamine diphosphorylase/glucosamine-1-phosphate N-acetyltransferase GlmU [Candidatus Fimivicinus intestinavium]|nr:bifunctional UDP-N-acetylglucosamine diphosphorylase/glucosamine-1-phosphate N-acetyltransferase GlmU [Candidatus Fimivicinus intestinavium]